MGLFFYAVVKFFAYSGHCYAGTRLVAPAGSYAPEQSLVSLSLGLGFGRWVLGAMIGSFLFLAVPDMRQDFWGAYVATYVPVRFFEWGVIAIFLFPTVRPGSQRFGWLYLILWLTVGIAISFITDLASPQWIQEGRLCSGRCFC